jgi:hypothetical protein
MSFQIFRKRKKTIVRELGNPNIDHIIDTKKLTCPCSSGSSRICDHIRFYLINIVSVKPEYVQCFKIPTIKNFIRVNNITSGKEINSFCYDYFHGLTDDYCMICYQSFLKKKDKMPMNQEEFKKIFCTCTKCGNMVHQSCQKKWDKGCVICMHGNPEKTTYGNVKEEFPPLV